MLSLKTINKKRALTFIWSGVAISWAIMVASLFISLEKPIAVTIVAVVAILTEIAIWLTALLLGVALVDARKAIWRRLTQWRGVPNQ